jgi:hypothetical protein
MHYFGRVINDARALVNIGGRMVNARDLMRYASIMNRKYGDKGGLLMDNPYDIFPGSFKPVDWRRLKYIDSTFDCSHSLHQRTSIATPQKKTSSQQLQRHHDTIREEADCIDSE